MKTFKGFKKDMTCRDFQYEVGKEYETESSDRGNSSTDFRVNSMYGVRHLSRRGGNGPDEGH